MKAKARRRHSRTNRYATPPAGYARTIERPVAGDVTSAQPANRVFEVERLTVLVGEMRNQLAIRTDQREHVEAELRALNAELEQRVGARTAECEAAIRELDAFSYSVSHDLRAPLRAIDGFARILVREHAANLDPAAQRHLDTICESAQRMGELIDELLTLSRLSRQALTTTIVSPTAVARRALAELEGERIGRTVAVNVSDMQPCRADPVSLERVYANLLGNALKFTRGTERAVIDVGCRQIDDALTYFVADNGAGFDMRYADKLFGVFQRLHRASEYEGTGLGLAIVQRIVLRHGGKVWADGAVGRGATFYFTLGGGHG